MPGRYRTSLIGGSLTAALAVATATFAIESDQTNWDLRPLVNEARELVGMARQQTVALDTRLRRGGGVGAAEGQYGGSPSAPGGSFEYTELKRSATRLAELGNEILDKASHCGEEARKIALKFRSRTQRFASSVRGLANASSASFASMSIGKVEKDLDSIEQSLPEVGSLSGCSKDSGDDEEEETEKSS